MLERVTLTEAQINEILDTIQGSCMSLEQAIALVTEDPDTGECISDLSELANEQELHDAVDRSHFVCAECGWWCEAGDYAEVQENPNGDVCSDCGPEEEEEDD